MNVTSLAPALVALPLAAAAILVAGLDRIPRRIAEALTIAAGIGVLAGCIVLWKDVVTTGTRVVWFGGWHPGNTVGLGVAFAIDDLGAAVATLVAVIVLAASVFSREYFEDVGTIFYVLLLAMLGAMIAFAFAADAFDLFVFYEVFSVAAYALAAYRIEAKSAYEGALQFAITSTVAGLFMLFGIMLLEGRTGELNLATIGHSLHAQRARDPLAAVSFAFVTVGLFTRGALAPLHFWFDEVHASAPTPLCAILSGAMAPLALFGFVRFYWSTYSAVLAPTLQMQALIAAVGVGSALIGSIMCLREPLLKRALAYSTVAHAGIAVCALATFRADALGGAAVYVATYALGAAGLFMAIAILRLRVTNVDVRRIAGCGRGLPLTAAVFALGTLDIAGVWSDRPFVAAPLIVLVGATTGGCFARAFYTIFLRQNSTVAQRGKVPWFLLAPAFVLCVLSGIVGWSADAGRFAATAAAAVIDRTAYEAVIMGAASHALPPHAGLHRSLLLAAGPLGALAIAALVVWRSRVAAMLRVRLRRDATLVFLARLHDGNSGQYIAWIAATALFAAVCFAV